MSTEAANLAKSLVESAESCATQKGGIFSFLFSPPDFDEAAELFKKAAIQYQVAGLYHDAGVAYERGAQCSAKGGLSTDEAHMRRDAANCYRKAGDISSAVRELLLGQQVLMNSGRFGAAGKMLQECAEIFATEKIEGLTTGVTLSRSLGLYERAISMYENDKFSTSVTSQCRQEMAKIYTKKEMYREAAEILALEARNAIKSDILRFSAKDLYFRAALLWMCLGDYITAKIHISEYFHDDPQLEGSREGNLITALLKAMENNDAESIDQHVKEFERVLRLDTFKCQLLNVIRGTLRPTSYKDEMRQDSIDLS